uniref:AlNc14C321G10586 protein n=1 Tax=Albugo laibachii Nc14 TaxID=890382 RepID=F0WWF2_9STRA|nr:AlNc14C321G10586 [Albugo laibachii Nc14]|eukprot:CCA25775.1 AlNc14C321G10586 [Albugo laibachii Nc14]
MNKASRKHCPANQGHFLRGTNQISDDFSAGAGSSVLITQKLKDRNKPDLVSVNTHEIDILALEYLPEPIPSHFSKNKARTYNTLQAEKRILEKSRKQTKVAIVGEGFEKNLNQCKLRDVTEIAAENKVIPLEPNESTESNGGMSTMKLIEGNTMETRFHPMSAVESNELEGRYEDPPTQLIDANSTAIPPQPCLNESHTLDSHQNDSESLGRNSQTMLDDKSSNEAQGNLYLESSATCALGVPQPLESIAQKSDPSQQLLEWDLIDIKIQRLEIFVAIHNERVRLSACKDGVKVPNIPITHSDIELNSIDFIPFVLWWSSWHNQRRLSFLNDMLKEAGVDKTVLRAWIDSIEKQGHQTDVLAFLSRLVDSNEHEKSTEVLQEIEKFYFGSHIAHLVNLESKALAIERELMRNQLDDFTRGKSVSSMLEASPRPQNFNVDSDDNLEISKLAVQTSKLESSVLEVMQTYESEVHLVDQSQEAEEHCEHVQVSLKWPLKSDEPNIESRDTNQTDSLEDVPEDCSNHTESNLSQDAASESEDMAYRLPSLDNESSEEELEEFRVQEQFRTHRIAPKESTKAKDARKRMELREAVQQQWNLIRQRQEQIDKILLDDERAKMEVEDARERFFLSVVMSERAQMDIEDQYVQELQKQKRRARVFEARRWLYDQDQIQREDEHSAEYEKQTIPEPSLSDTKAISQKKDEATFQPFDFSSKISPQRMLNDPMKKSKKLCGSYAIPFADTIIEEQLPRDTYVASASRKFYQLLGLSDLEGDIIAKGSTTKSLFLPFPSNTPALHDYRNFVSTQAPSRASYVIPNTQKDSSTLPKLVTKSSWKYKVKDPFTEPEERNKNMEDKGARLPFFRGHFGVRGFGKVHASKSV